LALVALATSLSAVPAQITYADGQPYFKSFGADVMTGGWWNSGSGCDTSTSGKYQDDSYPAGNTTTGGILAYASQDASSHPIGSSSQYGAISLGAIDGNAGPHYGFYSDGAAVAAGATGVNLLSFANTTGWGGLFQGTVRQGHCIDDYYTLKMPKTAPSTLASLSSSTATGIYSASAAIYNLSNADVTIAAGKQITIFVNGSVYIGHNILYAAGLTADNIPKFAIVAKGSIYVDPAVSELDGVYVAQPDASASAVTADTGVIWSCHPNNNQTPLYVYPTFNCRSKLTLNGAFIAKQINLLRIGQDVSTSSTTEDSLSSALASSNISEVLNYHPSIPLSGPFFVDPTDATNLRMKVDSLISLPPIF
jgi:hypothetical protein